MTERVNRWAGTPGRMGLVAVHTIKEAVRDRVFSVSILFSAILFSTALALTPLAAGQRDKLVQDLGLGAIAAIGLLLAVFIGTSTVYREIDKRTIYTLLARPISRGEYVTGKYVGLVLTVILNVMIMFTLYSALVHFYLHQFKIELLAAAYLIGVELAVISAFSLFFSVIASPFLGAFFTGILFVVGHLASDIMRFAEMLPDGIARKVFQGAGYVVPHLEYFNIKGMAVYGKPVTLEYMAWTTMYGLLYALALVLISVVIFRRKDLR